MAKDPLVTFPKTQFVGVYVDCIIEERVYVVLVIGF
jgi:hypothetical protein